MEGNLARIRVIGVGGGGSNAVNRMVEAGIQGVDFVAMNTDVQVLDKSLANIKIQLGNKLTKGLGAGGDPQVGRSAAEESKNEIRKILENSDMVFITAGMGGGTGTGASPIVADLAREVGALTVAIVTSPFRFEGARRINLARDGITSLIGRVDTLITIPNERLEQVVERKTTMGDAFRIADDILRQGVQGITDIITVPGQINVDFADVKAVMSNAGPALMDIGYGIGENRALQAAQSATSNKLLGRSIQGAKGVLVNFTSGEDLTLLEVNEAMEYIHGLCDPAEANIFFGSVIDPTLEGELRITVLATGFDPWESDKPAKPITRANVVAAVEPVSEKKEPTPTQIEPEQKRPAPAAIPHTPNRINPQDIWERAAATRENPAVEVDEDEEEMDVPAFLKAHRERKEQG